MSVALAQRIAGEVARLSWNPRIEFTGRGEPTVNPELPAIVRAFRDALPKASILVTSNGSGVMSVDRVRALFASGVNTLALDDYSHATFVGKIRERVLPELELIDGIPVHTYPDDRDASPHGRYFKRRIVIIRDIAELTTGNHQLTNQGGNSVPGDDALPLQQRCAKPFREFSIRWDGNVAVCCDDWRGVYKIANVNKLPLDEVWNHPRWQAARTLLYAADRAALAPCNVCNVRTYRNGLLPDKYGKHPMAAPTQATRTLAAGAMAGKVFSIKLAKGDK
jgi:MoaA/NifB/PqqE/SkfB family radical SAM enzyme